MNPSRIDRISEFYQMHREGLYGYALALTGCRSAAEDAVQTAICRILNRAILPRRLKSFAYRCVRNAAVDEWRKHAARRDSLFDLETLPADGPDAADVLAIEELLYQLPPDHRELIVLKTFHGLTFREIAVIRHESTHTVASRYRRAIHQMRETLQEKPT